MRRASFGIAFAVSIGGFAVAACPRKPDDQKPPPIASSATKVATASTTVVVPLSASQPAVPGAPPVACAVAFASDGAGVKPGDDLSEVAVPMRIPAGASVTVVLRKSDHEVNVEGPAVIRPCTRAEPEVILVASGKVSIDSTVPVRPGSKIYVATPSAVAVVGRATLSLDVSPSLTLWTFDGGDANFTTLDEVTAPKPHDHGAIKRFDNGGLLLTRCGVQAASQATTERLLASIGADAGPPLPAASIGILTAEEVKHAGEKTLDCAFAEAFGLSCDLLKAGEAKLATEKPSGCQGGYAAVLEHVAASVASAPLPPGAPVKEAPSASSH